MFFLQINLILILASVMLNSFALCQSPISPCPKIFHYENDGQQWYGVIEIPSPSLGSTLKLDLKLSIKTKLPTKYVGRVELLGERSDLIQSLLKGGKLRYKVHFPILGILPKVTAVIFNKEMICTGPPANGNFVTAINIGHTLHTGTNGAEMPNYQHKTSTVSYDDNVNDNAYSKAPATNNNDEIYSGVQVRPTSDSKVFVVDSVNRPNPDTFANPSQSSSKPKRPVMHPRENNKYICGVSKKTSNALIVGGDETTKGDWPWLTAVFVKKVSGLDFICAGSLVSSKHVISAAHCVFQKNNRPVKVHEIVLKLGAFNLQDWTDESTKTTEVSEIKMHPDFEGGLVLKTDIVILVINAVKFTDYIIPVCLWEGNADLKYVIGKKGVVIGWGRDENGLVATPEPRQANVPIVSTEVCRASRPEFYYLTSEFTMCAGGRDGTGPCNGDSGGGMFLMQKGRWSLRGIVSNSLKDPMSPNTCNLKEYVVFTDSAKYLTWIKNVIAGH